MGSGVWVCCVCAWLVYMCGYCGLRQLSGGGFFCITWFGERVWR